MTSVHNSDWIEFDLTKNQAKDETTEPMQKQFASWEFPREDKAQRTNHHIGPIPIVIPLKLFLERAGLPADNISSRVGWKFHGGAKVQNKSEVQELR